MLRKIRYLWSEYWFIPVGLASQAVWFFLGWKAGEWIDKVVSISIVVNPV